MRVEQGGNQGIESYVRQTDDYILSVDEVKAETAGCGQVEIDVFEYDGFKMNYCGEMTAGNPHGGLDVEKREADLTSRDMEEVQKRINDELDPETKYIITDNGESLRTTSSIHSTAFEDVAKFLKNDRWQNLCGS